MTSAEQTAAISPPGSPTTSSPVRLASVLGTPASTSARLAFTKVPRPAAVDRLTPVCYETLTHAAARA
ncbi:hypothetical protein [Blastococcus aurantiacus]|uniref:hypothetical protein n=1 Tax=Blastococcus aurantiacus TaxID=1550231 RepID=UPI000B83D8B9|nr:hypothetical protein [Blastococcus aurantiacus]